MVQYNDTTIFGRFDEISNKTERVKCQKNDIIFIDVIFFLYACTQIIRVVWLLFFSPPVRLIYFMNLSSIRFLLPCKTSSVYLLYRVGGLVWHWYQYMAIIYFFGTSDLEYIIACNKSKTLVSFALSVCFEN